MAELSGLCSVCGKVAHHKCSLCGKLVCDEHFDARHKICASHAKQME